MSSQVEETSSQHETTQHAHGPVSEAKMIERNATPGTPNFQRQTSSGTATGALSSSYGSGVSTTPVQTVTAYLKNLLGLSAKPTKRTLSEEAECGSPDSLREWLRQGSDPNEIDPYGYTPLVNACLRGCKKSVTVLLANGADPNKKAMHGYTPLHAAAQNGFFELVELLLDHGAALEAKNDDGDTPLMLAVRSDHAEVVDALCKRGCNMHTHGFDNIEPIDYALNKRNLYVSDVLMKHERQHIHQTPPPSSPTGSPASLAGPTIPPSPLANTGGGAPITTATPAAEEILTEKRRSLTTLLLEQQEAHHAAHAAHNAHHRHAAVNKVHLDRLDSEPDQEIPNNNLPAEPIFQSE